MEAFGDWILIPACLEAGLIIKPNAEQLDCLLWPKSSGALPFTLLSSLEPAFSGLLTAC